jgi:hypothetical protein
VSDQQLGAIVLRVVPHDGDMPFYMMDEYDETGKFISGYGTNRGVLDLTEIVRGRLRWQRWGTKTMARPERFNPLRTTREGLMRFTR